MTFYPKTALVVAISMVFALSACKPKPGEPTAEQQAAAAAAAAATAVPPATSTTPVAAPAAPTAAAPAQKSSTAIADLDKIAVSTKPVPPFPYIDYPPAVHEALRSTEESDFDQVVVIVGDKVHTVEGRVKVSKFKLADVENAKLSEFQAKRDYTKAALDMGGVKVNTVLPHDEAFYAANGMGGENNDARDDMRYAMNKKTKYEGGHSYDVFFIPTASGRKWLAVMVSDSNVRLLAIEEKTAESSVKLTTDAQPAK